MAPLSTMRKRRSVLSIFSSLLLFTGAVAGAATLAISPSADNTLYELSDGSKSNGAGSFLFAGKTGGSAQFALRRAVLSFDIAGALPANAVITGVTLTLHLSNSPFFAGDTDVTLHRLLASWGEEGSKAPAPEGTGGIAEPGDATWTHRFYDDPTRLWSTPGGDYVQSASASTMVGRTSVDVAVPYSWSSSGMLSDVQNWYQDPTTNFGWIVRSSEEIEGVAKRFNSRQHPDVSTRPVLTVQYDLVPEPGAAILLVIGAALMGTGRRAARRTTLVAIALLLANPAASFAAGPIAAEIQKGNVTIELETIASGLTAPNLLISAPGDADRQFIVDQNGKIFIVENGAQQATPFLDMGSRLVNLSAGYDERGLLGLAFDPEFAVVGAPGFGRIFTYSSEPVSGAADLANPYSTTSHHQSVVASWRVDAANPNRINPASRQEVLRIDQPQGNHNGGMLAFGPDDLLYIALGDGGGANDSNPSGHNPTIGNGQDPNIALGKILRIDVNGTNSANGKYGIPVDNPYATSGGVKEIYASGFRNPFRFSFDGNRLIVPDVGQNNIEELNLVTLGGNYGWRYKEGSFRFDPATGQVSTDLTGLPAGLIDPLLEYDHDEGISIIGGFVYNGTLIPELAGKYVFGDFGLSFSNPSGRLFYADLTTTEILEFQLGPTDRPFNLFLKGMGLDQDGEIYVLASTLLGPSGSSGMAMKIVPEPSAAAAMLFALVLGSGRRWRRRV